MIPLSAVVPFVLIIGVTLVLRVTPWRQLPVPVKLWGGVSLLNTLVFMGLPSSAATSPWRPAIGFLATLGAGLSIPAVIVGVVLWRRRRLASRCGSGWFASLSFAALPGLLYALGWAWGPVY